MRRIEARNRKWFPDYVPAYLRYRELAKATLGGGTSVLHLGAGRDSLGVVAGLEAPSARVVSLDIDREGLAHNSNRLRVVAGGERLPFRDQIFDLVLSDNVFEHLAEPLRVLKECRRSLRPGGALVFLCPNRFSYIAVLSRLTPHPLHVAFRRTLMGTAESDTFRTYYRLNSVGQIRRLARDAGLRVEHIQSYVGWPTYWEFSDRLHQAAVFLHRVLETLPSWAHITLVGLLRRVD